MKKLFIVREIGKGINEEYHMMMTNKEMTAYLKALNENNGYIPGLGGDKSYSAVAWHAKG